jgi:hypothetical protein
MLSSQDEQAERRRTFAQDQSVPRQGTTFHQHALADALTPRGRFTAVEAAYVVGSTATPQYPQASTPFQREPVPDEPPTGERIDELEPLHHAPPVLAQELPTPASGDSAGVGLFPDQSGDPAVDHHPVTPSDVKVGSPVRPYRRF